MSGINLGPKDNGDLEGMLSAVSAAETRIEDVPKGAVEEGEITILKLTIAACKADIIDLLDRAEGNNLVGADIEMLVEFLHSEIEMLKTRLQNLMISCQARRHRRLQDRVV